MPEGISRNCFVCLEDVNANYVPASAVALSYSLQTNISPSAWPLSAVIGLQLFAPSQTSTVNPFSRGKLLE